MNKPLPMWREEGKDYTVGYMCLIDFECEIGGNCNGNTVYPSVKDLEEHHKCVAECGIAKVKVEGIRIVKEGTY